MEYNNYGNFWFSHCSMCRPQIINELSNSIKYLNPSLSCNSYSDNEHCGEDIQQISQIHSRYIDRSWKFTNDSRRKLLRSIRKVHNLVH